MGPGTSGWQGATALVGAPGAAGAHVDPLPERWTVSRATVEATLVALKESIVPPADPPPAERELPRPVQRDLPPLPTRRSLREAAASSSAAGPSRARLLTRLMTVRAFRTRHAQARAAGAPAAAVGAILDAAAVHHVLTLHRRSVPGQRGHLDHLVISESGVHVVDVLHFKKAAIEVVPAVGGAGSVDLVVGGRVLSPAAAATGRRAEAVRSALAAAGFESVPVTGTLCFVDGLFPLGAAQLEVGGVRVLHPNALTSLVVRGGSSHGVEVRTLEQCLGARFPECR